MLRTTLTAPPKTTRLACDADVALAACLTRRYGIGTALVAAIGVVLFREPLSALRVGGVLCVIAGVVALHLAETSSS